MEMLKILLALNNIKMTEQLCFSVDILQVVLKM